MTLETSPPISETRPDGLARVEDRRLLTGRGLYVHDVRQPGMLHAVFVRSVYPCARLLSIDVAAAQASDGVVAVLGGADLAGLTLPPPNALLPGIQAPASLLLPLAQVDAVGQPIVVVLATSLGAAQSAAEQVFVDYEALPAQADLADLADAAPPVATVRHRHREPRGYSDIPTPGNHNWRKHAIG